MSELYRIARVKVLVCAVERGESVHIPDGRFKLQKGDKLFVTASTQDLTALIKHLGLYQHKIKNAILVGGSRIAYYLTRLLTEAGIHVKLIETDPARCEQLAELLPQADILHADGSNQAVLRAEGIERTDAVVTLTNIDEENLLISMYANYLKVPKVVTKINRTEYSEVIRGKGIDCVISPKLLCANDIVRYVRAMQNSQATNVRTLHRLVGGKVEALEFGVTADVPFAGVPLRDLNLRKNILVAGIIRENGKTIIPSGNDSFCAGDDVIIVTTNTDLTDLRDIMARG